MYDLEQNSRKLGFYQRETLVRMASTDYDVGFEGANNLTATRVTEHPMASFGQLGSS